MKGAQKQKGKSNKCRENVYLLYCSSKPLFLHPGSLKEPIKYAHSFLNMQLCTFIDYRLVPYQFLSVSNAVIELHEVHFFNQTKEF